MTLVMACVSAAAGLRRTQIFDRCRISVREHTWIEAESRCCRLYLTATNHGRANATFEWRNSGWTADTEESRIIPRADNLLLHFMGIGIGAVTNPARDWIKKAVLILPYCSIVMPLTLLSVWLLFSQPRAKKNEPIELTPKTES